MNMVKPSVIAAAVLFTFLSGGAMAQTAATASPASTMGAPTALKLIDRKVGGGALAETGSPVNVHYTGYLWNATAPDNKGAKFDSSIDRKVPFGFILGAGGDRGAGGAIPPNATLVFDVELVSVVGKTMNASGTPSAYVPAPTK